MYELFDDVLEQKTFLEQYEKLRTCSNWCFSGHSGSKEGYNFWYRELIDDEFFSKKFFKKIKKITKKDFSLCRLYANGQTYGLPGDLHIDDERDNAYTFLFYMNPEWSVRWGGQTILYKNGKEFTSFFPKPNSGILFKGNMLHVGMDPSRYCKELRITVAFKLELKND